MESLNTAAVACGVIVSLACITMHGHGTHPTSLTAPSISSVPLRFWSIPLSLKIPCRVCRFTANPPSTEEAPSR